MLGTANLQKFFDSFAAVAKLVFFDQAGKARTLGSDTQRVSEDCLQSVRQHDRTAAIGFGARPHFPTQDYAFRCCMRRYFADYQARYALCLMSSLQRRDASMLENVRNIQSFEDLVGVFTVYEDSPVYSPSSKRQKIEIDLTE
jgi:hypothetical protein